MKMTYVTLRVGSIEKTQAFYEDILGFEQERVINPRPGMTIVFLKGRDSSGVELIQEEEFTPRANNVVLTFRVEDMAATLEFLKEKQIPLLMGPVPIGGGGQMVQIADPDGQMIGLIDVF
ncbi:MAG: hypothetical protein AVO33_02060 [delta proteobacterium ML8_F1]|nr:MAG: hypothetical protein AVO33_02060 [delta proteobacterium ML8_F1]